MQRFATAQANQHKRLISTSSNTKRSIANATRRVSDAIHFFLVKHFAKDSNCSFTQNGPFSETFISKTMVWTALSKLVIG